MSQILIAVYRMHQPTLVSPCLLGDPCATCKLHQRCVVGLSCYHCRRGRPFECERQTPARPAFIVDLNEALRLIHNREAVFIHRNTALQLTYPRPAHLRDLSCNVDPEVMFQYVSGWRRARVAVDLGWQAPPDIATAASAEQNSAVLGFA